MSIEVTFIYFSTLHRKKLKLEFIYFYLEIHIELYRPMCTSICKTILYNKHSQNKKTLEYVL